MSTTSGNRATPSSSNDTDMTDDGAARMGNITVNKPDLYHGERNKLDDWLMQWDLFFMFQGERVEEGKRVTLVSSYMRGAAFKWIKPFVQQYNAGEAPDEVDVWMKDFDAFKEQIKPVFGVFNEVSSARREIQRIKQTKSAADYAAEFQQLAAHTDWDDTALSTMFRQGLKPKIKEELMRTGASTDTFNALVNTAIDIDVKLYELQLELRDDPRARATNSAPHASRNPWKNNLRRGQRGGRYQSNTSRRVHTGTNTGYYGAEAMDLSNINKGPERWNVKNKGSSGTSKPPMTCYGCGKAGHFARDCRSKNKVTRQLNMLSSKRVSFTDASDWEIITDDMGRLMEDPETESGTDDEYIEPDEDQRNVRSSTPIPHQWSEEVCTTKQRGSAKYQEHCDQMLQVLDRRLEAEHWADAARRISNERMARDKESAGRYALNNDILDIVDNEPAVARIQLQKLLQRYNDGETPVTVALDPRVRENCENALVSIHKLLKKPEEWYDEWFADYQRNNYATIETLQRANQDIPAQDEPDVRRMPARRRTTPWYLTDTRNLLHYTLSWIACSTDSCTVHYDDKMNSGWFPSTKQHCYNKWYECKDDTCEVHLWDKRQQHHFPGEKDTQYACIKWLLINDHCLNPCWQRCLHDDCKGHKEAKKQQGFLEHEEVSDSEDESFLDQRKRYAPGIDPSTISVPIA